MSVITKDLGVATAYGYAKSKGYTGTEEEFAELMASYADVAQQAEAAAQDAEDAKDAAITAKTAAQTAQTAAESAQTAAAGSAQTASTKASEASNSAQTAAGSATAAQTSATAASGSAQTAQTAAQTATTKASEASSSASAASTAKTGAETARTGAQTAQTAAETAQENAEAAASSVSASAAQIEQNTEEIGAIKNDFTQITDDVILSDNMFDGVFGITGGVNVDGTFNTNSNFVRSDYKPFKAGTNRTLYSNSSGSFWFAVYTFTSDKTPIAAVANNNPISDNAAYFVVYKQATSSGDYYVGITAFDDDYSYSAGNVIKTSSILDNAIGRNKLNYFYQSDTVNITSGDLNDVIHATLVLVNAGVSNTPDVRYRWFVKTDAFPWASLTGGRHNLMQTAYNVNEPRDIWMRMYDSGNGNEILPSWSNWVSYTAYMQTETNTNGMVGKKVVLMGDSTYAITGETGKRVSTFLEELGNCTVYDCSFGGTRLSDCRDEQVGGSSSDTYKYFDFPRLVDAIIAGNFSDQDANLSGKAQEYATNLATLKTVDFSEIDYLCIEYGANDFTGNVPLGTNASDKTTVRGALIYCVNALMTEYPNLVILVDGMRYRAWLDSSSQFVDDVFTHKNTLDLATGDYVSAIREQSGLFGLPFFDNLTHYGWNKYNRSVYFPANDGAHFNVAGVKYAAKALCAHMSAIGKSQSL